jgi:hypothetical protein
MRSKPGNRRARWPRVVSGAVILAALGHVAVAARDDDRPAPVNVFFDSDIGPEVDDAGACAILNAMADRGEARIIGMACCTSSPWGAPCLDAINTYYGRPDVPIGTFKGPGFLADSKYNRQIAERFPNDLKNGANAPDATEVYRRVLSRQKDGSVVVCAVGPQNNLARLLDSGPDRFSKLNGRDLVAKKVRELVVMGGRYPEGKEWNLEQDPKAAAAVAERWPTRILASGFEIGEKVKTGGRLWTETPAENPVRAAFELYVGAGKDRESWDETGVLAAVRGAEPLWSFPPLSYQLRVDPKDGSNRTQMTTEGPFTYLVQRAPVTEVKQAIEDLMVQAPKRR